MRHFFVDETKAKGFRLCAVALESHRLSFAREQVNQLRLRGQRRIHFVDESDSRRRQILSVLADLEPEVTFFECALKSENTARELALTQLVKFAGLAAPARLVIEKDETHLAFDRRILSTEVRFLGLGGEIQFRHETAMAEPLLVLPDALAWVRQRSGAWKREMTRFRYSSVKLD
jgi:hypothetical protein